MANPALNPNGELINVFLKDSPKKPIGTFFVKVTKIETESSQGVIVKPATVPDNQNRTYFVKITQMTKEE